MRKMFLTSWLVLCITGPASVFADSPTGISVDVSNTPATVTNDDCTENVLGDSQIANKSAKLKERWQPNEITIEWDKNNANSANIADTTCIYDGPVTLPQNPTRLGYKFDGWVVANGS